MRRLRIFGPSPAIGLGIALALVLLATAGCVKLIAGPLLLPESALTPADAIVVLGFGPPVNDAGEPHPEIARRVAKAVELYRAGLAPALIVTGGNTYRDYYESAVMKKAAVGLGVPPEAVLEEREAMDTIGNARYTSRIMRERGWQSCILVSSPYHLKRARALFEAAGLTVQTAAAEAPPGAGYAILASLHEYGARFQYLFIDEQAQVRGEQGDRHTERIRGPVRARVKVTP